jgi:hypothetical protein
MPVGDVDSMVSKRTGKRAGRIIGNFDVVDDAKGGERVTVFSSPLRLQIRYGPGDLLRALQKGRSLELMWWDGEDWQVFEREKHGFVLHSDADPTQGGFASLTIRKWEDPPLAWAP